jgi:hypothetical protein
MRGHARIVGRHPRADPQTGEPEAFHGFRPFPSRGGLVTNEIVERLRDEEGLGCAPCSMRTC